MSNLMGPFKTNKTEATEEKLLYLKQSVYRFICEDNLYWFLAITAGSIWLRRKEKKKEATSRSYFEKFSSGGAIYGRLIKLAKMSFILTLDVCIRKQIDIFKLEYEN